MADEHIEPLTIPASTLYLQTVRSYILQHIGMLDFNEFEENGIVLAVDEAVSNLIRHAYRGDDTKKISITLSVDDDEVQVEICDTADAFDPASAESPDMRQYFIDRRRGGLGILLMTRVMDTITYKPAAVGDRVNTLTLTKRRRS
ncbi:MAG: ATP-binding protein [bacterium]|nr:ATP-binding protein [bacterium]